MNAAFPYLLAGSAGAYVAAIYAMLSGRWQAPTRPEWWLLLPAFAAFALDRAYADLAFVAAPVTFACCALLLTRLLRSPQMLDARGALWVLFACVPLATAIVIVAGDFLSQSGASALGYGAAWLLVVPGLTAVAAGLARGLHFISQLRKA